MSGNGEKEKCDPTYRSLRKSSAARFSTVLLVVPKLLDKVEGAVTAATHQDVHAEQFLLGFCSLRGELLL